jgi:hypothetical protein
MDNIFGYSNSGLTQSLNGISTITDGSGASITDGNAIFIDTNTNTATINNASDHLLGAKSSITIAGGQNTVSVSQSGPAGATGFDAMVDVTGSSNNIGVTQTGTVDSKVNVKSVGSNNTITVRSGN